MNFCLLVRRTGSGIHDGSHCGKLVGDMGAAAALQYTRSGSSSRVGRAESSATNEAGEHSAGSAASPIRGGTAPYLLGACPATATARGCAEHEIDVWMEEKDYGVGRTPGKKRLSTGRAGFADQSYLFPLQNGVSFGPNHALHAFRVSFPPTHATDESPAH